MAHAITLNDVLDLAKQLSPEDKVRLIERIAPQIERDLKSNPALPRQSVRGLWRGLNLSAEDIAEARREMWGNFPRENL